MDLKSFLFCFFSRCSAALSCRSCVALQDPYCAWDTNRGFCSSLHEYQDKDTNSVDSVSFVQNVVTGKHAQCPVEEGEDEDLLQELPSSRVLLDQSGLPRPEGDLAGGDSARSDSGSRDFVSRDPNLAYYSAEELSMAVATSCVCALVFGFITGFLMARKCSCRREVEENPYHVPYLNQ